MSNMRFAICIRWSVMKHKFCRSWLRFLPSIQLIKFAFLRKRKQEKNVVISSLKVTRHLCCKIMQKSDPPCTFPSITLLLDHLSKICMIRFWPSDQRCQKYVYIFKVTSNGRAEIQNRRIFEVLHILNFSSATSGHFSNVNILLTSLANWSKKYHTDFWNMV